MRIEIIFPALAIKEIVHISNSGMKKIPVNPASKKDNIMPDFLAYAEKYIAENGFKLLNVDQDKLYIYKDWSFFLPF